MLKSINQRIGLVLLTLLFFQANFNSLKASHVVGGEINYECLGGNQYRIILRQYRDCSGINFPDPARIDVYNSSGTQLQTISIPLPPTVTLTPTPPGPCTEVPSGVCVEAVEYITTVNLPPIPGGYFFEFNECCRNGGIVNGPSGSASYSAEIPDISLAACNSNPKITDWPPVFVCQNVPLNVDMSATDIDGDSLYYSLCSPMEGINSPYPFSAPYSTSDPLNGGMSINPQTGLITGTPTTVGRFVVGACVSEYRNGNLLSTTTRDFQFNVVECEEVAVASALTALTDCNNFGVTFFNSSIGGVSYLWDFGDGDTSTLFEPTHNYSNIGNYNVTLIAFASDPQCNDTLTSLVAVADTCRPCGMSVNITTTDGVCNPANGCYDIQFYDPACTGGSSVTNGVVYCGGQPMPGPNSTINYQTYRSPTCSGTSVSNSGGTVTTYMMIQEPQTGKAVANVTGGNPAYNIQWVTNPIQTGDSATNLDPGQYTVIVTDINGCVEVVDFGINGDPAFTINASATDPTSCGANDGTLNVTITGATNGTPTYLWTPGGYATANVNNVPPGTYTVSVNDNDSCPATATVTVNPVTTINVSANVTDVVCPGDSTGTATVVPATGGTAPYTYSWNTFPTPSTGTSISNLGKGFYTVSATDDNGCQGQYSFTVNGPLPITFNGSVTGASCFNTNDGSATVSPSGGNGGYTYAWSPSGGTGATASNLLGGTYTATVTDAQGCTADTTINVNRPTALDADLVDNSTIDCAGNFVGALQVVPTGGTQKVNNPVPVFTEDFNLPNGTDTTANWDTSGDQDWTDWSVQNGEFFGQNVDQEAVWTSTCIDISTCSNVVLSLDAAASTNTDPTDRFQVFYRLDAGPEVLLLDLHDENDIAAYPTFANLTGNIPNGGCVEIIIKVQMASSTEQYYFDNVMVSCVPNVFDPYDYSWTCSSSTADTANNLPLGLCTVTVTDGNGCTTQDTMTIASPGVLTTTMSSKNACGGTNDGTATALTTGGTAPYSYSWDCVADTTQNISGLASGTTCNVTVTDANGCTTNESVVIGSFPALSLDTIIDLGTCNNDASIDLTVIGGTGPFIYSWSNGDTTEDVSGLGPDTTYTVSVFDANLCFDTLSAYIPVILCLQVTATAAPDTICLGDTTLLSATSTSGTPPYTYVWDNVSTLSAPNDSTTLAFPTTTTTYKVVVTDSIGKKDSTTITVVVNPIPTAIDQTPAALCEDVQGGGTAGGVDLTNNEPGINGGAVSYSWFSDPGLTSVVSNPTNVSVTNGQIFYVLVTDNVTGCQDTAMVTYTVNPSPTADAGNDVFTCIGNTVTLQGNGGGTYSWSPSIDLNDSTLQNPISTPTANRTYTLTVTNASGCSDSAIVNINIDGPVALFTINPTGELLTEEEIMLTDQSTGGVVRWFWNFADGRVDSIQNPTITYNDAGTYSICLTVYDINDCDHTTCEDVTYYHPLLIPNVFTPNGDGANDYFVIEGLRADSKIIIYDRWGIVMFETNDYLNNWWDGTTKGGKDVPSGTYYYILTLHDETVHNGIITLLKD